MTDSDRPSPDKATMKLRVASTLKWNVIDRVSTQLLYAVTGIILARLLTPADFGLVGAVLVFQAFASLFVDSGMASALIQRKSPTHLDYSTVLWFNIGMAAALYAVLWVCAPLIADCFQGDQRLVPLSRVMFLTFILNATAIVQTNRLMKRMDVRMIAVSNATALICAAIVAIVVAVEGYGVWAVVWQSITLAAVKSAVLWATSRWLPLMQFSWRSLRSFFKVGMGVMFSSLLNTIFLNIYSFLIGNRVGMAPLGYYTQADKWSKMGISSLSQVLTASFLPALSEFQHDVTKFAAATAKMNRFTAYLLFPAVGLLCVMATPIFHLLFGQKWDPAISLFCILLVRGIFTVLTSLYNNYILSLGKARLLVVTEVIRDVVAAGAIVATIGMMGYSTPDNIVAGLEIFLWGQAIASAATWVVTLVIAARVSCRNTLEYVTDLLPYLCITMLAMIPCVGLSFIVPDNNPLMLLSAQIVVGAAIYIGINAISGSKVQSDVFSYFGIRK